MRYAALVLLLMRGCVSGQTQTMTYQCNIVSSTATTTVTSVTVTANSIFPDSSALHPFGEAPVTLAELPDQISDEWPADKPCPACPVWKVKPEPVDVPAIKQSPETLITPIICGGKCDPLHIPARWICADKSRILLTAEDGTKHCVKY